MSSAMPDRPYCLPGCNRLDGHDGTNVGACMSGGRVLYPGPLDLEHRPPDAPAPAPAPPGLFAYDLAPGCEHPPLSPGESWTCPACGWVWIGQTPLRNLIPRARSCYRLASGAMVHVKPDCRC